MRLCDREADTHVLIQSSSQDTRKLETEARALQIFIPAPSEISHSGEFPRLYEDNSESGGPDSARLGVVMTPRGTAERQHGGGESREENRTGEKGGSRCLGSSGGQPATSWLPPSWLEL